MQPLPATAAVLSIGIFLLLNAPASAIGLSPTISAPVKYYPSLFSIQAAAPAGGIRSRQDQDPVQVKVDTCEQKSQSPAQTGGEWLFAKTDKTVCNNYAFCFLVWFSSPPSVTILIWRGDRLCRTMKVSPVVRLCTVSVSPASCERRFLISSLSSRLILS